MPIITLEAAEGGNFAGYLAAPRGGPAPGVIVIQEIFGVNAAMRAIADAFAAKGYVALCPDLFWRQEPGVQITDKTDAEWQRALALMQGFNETKGISDLITATEILRRREECAGPVGSVGYCLGGRLAYLMATRANTDCDVSYYGVGIENLLEESSAITRPLLLHIAGEDKYVPKDAQARIHANLSANPMVTLHTYPGVDHAFARPGGITYDRAAAELANKRTLAFFAKHLRKEGATS